VWEKVGLPIAMVTLPALRIVEVGNVLTRDERELAALEHEAGKVAHYWLCLYVKIVAEHNVGAPAAEQLDHIRVDSGAQKCHGATGVDGVGTATFRQETDTGPLVVTSTRRAEVTCAGDTPDQCPDARR
jgi:hypothetical protein